MFRHTSALRALTLTALLIVGCNEPLAVESRVSPPLPPSPETGNGEVVRLGIVDQLDQELWLVNGEESTYLVGAGAAPLASIVGAEVEVRGTFDAADGLVVSMFLVRGMKGMPAADGYLEEDHGSYLLVRVDGSIVEVLDPPLELRENLGKRVWIAGPEGHPPVSFGVIAAY